MKSILLGIWLTFGTDAASTHYALTQRNAKEVVIPTQNPFAIDAIVLGEAGLASFGLNRLNHDHPKLTKIVGWSIIGMRSFVVTRNIMELRK